MKKVLVVLVVLIVALTGVFADTPEANPDELKVYGKILQGESSFTVTPSEKEVIDLANNLAVRHGGGGVKVGAWSYVATSQPGNTKFTIGYDLTKLVSVATSREFTFKVLESIVSGGDAYSNKTILFSGSADIQTNILVELAEGEAVFPGDQPTDDFVGTITISLTAAD